MGGIIAKGCESGPPTRGDLQQRDYNFIPPETFNNYDYHYYILRQNDYTPRYFDRWLEIIEKENLFCGYSSHYFFARGKNIAQSQ